MLLGANPTPPARVGARRRLNRSDGSVESVKPYLWASAVSVAPLFVARGLQNKVLEATAAGLPAW
jgi:hypothetical protein